MQRIFGILGIGLVGLSLQWGCYSDSYAPPPPPARVPGQMERRYSYDYGMNRPLPEQTSSELPPPPYRDPALVSQEAPELPAFVQAYDRVGRPRLLVWVTQPAGNTYDEAAARSIDYAAVENILIDWLSAQGRVAIIAPEAARQALTPQQAQSLNSFRPAETQDISDRLKADVLVLVQAQPTRQSSIGPEIRFVASASNLKGGESLGRAVVDVPPPLEKRQINAYTRFVARKLMSDMTNAWNNGGTDAEGTQPQPPVAPPRPQSTEPNPPPATQNGTRVDQFFEIRKELPTTQPVFTVPATNPVGPDTQPSTQPAAGPGTLLDIY